MPELSNLPIPLVKLLRDLGYREFVETGTGLGNTTAVAARHLDRVWTIEIHEGRREKARGRFCQKEDVHCLLGNSVDALPKVLARLLGPAIFFLDAHCIYRTLCAPTECPLLEEIRIIRGDNAEHTILIDDAKFFIATAHSRCDVEQWPELIDVIDALRDGGEDPFIFIHRGCICAIPRKHKGIMVDYLRGARG